MKLLLYTIFLVVLSLSCEDDYVTIERNIIDAETKVPIYFYATAEQSGLDTWRPVFTYLIYSV